MVVTNEAAFNVKMEIVGFSFAKRDIPKWRDRCKEASPDIRFPEVKVMAVAMVAGDVEELAC